MVAQPKNTFPPQGMDAPLRLRYLEIHPFPMEKQEPPSSRPDLKGARVLGNFQYIHTVTTLYDQFSTDPFMVTQHLCYLFDRPLFSLSWMSEDALKCWISTVTEVFNNWPRNNLDPALSDSPSFWVRGPVHLLLLSSYHAMHFIFTLISALHSSTIRSAQYKCYFPEYMSQ